MSALRSYNRQGEPISDDECHRLMVDNEYRRVDLTEQDGVKVSTVWLAFDHSWGYGPPLIFETLIFGGPYDEYMWRYTTEAEARAGHERAVRVAFFGEEPED